MIFFLQKIMDTIKSENRNIIKSHGHDRLLGMEGLRAYAVILVFSVHFLSNFYYQILIINPNNFFPFDIYEKTGNPIDILGFYLFRSHYGVDLFFVISGFLIFRMLLTSRRSLIDFAIGRVKRIYPAFLAALALSIIIKVWLTTTHELDSILIFKSIFLNEYKYMGVAWSLAYEFIFYAIAPVIVLFITKRCFTTQSKFVVILIIFSAITIYSPKARFAMFFAGAAIAMIRNDELKLLANKVPDTVTLTAFIMTTTAYAFSKQITELIFPLGITLSFLFISAIYGTGVINKTFSSIPMRWLGNISYSFYLIHGTAITIVFWCFKPIFRSMGIEFLFISTLLSSIVLASGLSWVFYQLFEQPYFSKSKQVKVKVKPSIT